MKSISVARIDKTNPIARIYLRRAGLLENEETMEQIPFLAIYRNSKYEGASVVILDKENSKAQANVTYFNFLDSEDFTQEVSGEITSLINENYGIKEVEINPVKVLSL